METRMDPSRIYRLMERRRIRSAKELAARLHASERTVRRLLSGKLSDNPRALSLERLAEVLGVEPGVLTGEEELPDDTEQERQEPGGTVRLNVKIGAGPYNALILNELRYGVPVKTQVELAALLFHIVAQRSLRHRRQALERTYAANDDLEKLWSSEASHLPCATMWRDFVAEAYEVEEQSIAAEDVFAEMYHPEASYPESPNPFESEILRLVHGNPETGQLIAAEKDFVCYRINPEQAVRFAAGDKDLAKAILRGCFSIAGLRQLLADEKAEERVAELRRRHEEAARRIIAELGLEEFTEDDPDASSPTNGGAG